MGVRGGKLLKRVQVEGLEVKAKSGSGDSEAEGVMSHNTHVTLLTNLG